MQRITHQNDKAKAIFRDSSVSVKNMMHIPAGTCVGLLLGTALFIAGCGKTRESVADKDAPATQSGTLGDQATAFVEPLEEAAAAVKLAFTGLVTGKSDPTTYAYKFQGGPIFVRVAVYNDWEFEGLGQRRTVLASQSYFPQARSGELFGDALQLPPEHTFARHSGLAVVIDDGQFRVAVQRRSVVKGGGATSSSISRNQFRMPDRFSRTDVRLRRSFTIEQLRQNSEYSQGFRTQATSGTSNRNLRTHSPLKAGASRELFTEWPVRWGPDDTPIVLEVTLTRLPLPVEYDSETLRETIQGLRKEIEAAPDKAQWRLLLAVCLDMLARMVELKEGEERQLAEERVQQMRRAVANEPSNQTFQDRLRWDLYGLAWHKAQSDEYAQTAELLEEMLQHRPNFNDFDHAARTIQRSIYSASKDPSLDDAEKQVRIEHYRRLAADYLRRGLRFELDHGGMELLRSQREYVRRIGPHIIDRTTHIDRLLVEFEHDPALVRKNIERLQAEAKDAPDDPANDYLLAAAFGMLANRAEWNDPERLNLERTAVEHSRQAVSKAPDNPVYQRRLRRQLLDYAWTVADGSEFAKTLALVDEVLLHDPAFADYVRGASAVWRAERTATGEKHRGEKTEQQASRPYRDKFIAVLRAGLAHVQETRPDDYRWLVQQLPAAVPYPSTKWPEFGEFLREARKAAAKSEP